MTASPAALFTLLRTAATTLVGLSTLGYVCGYLAMRARASAFGTDPGFTLVDEAYVFAGFRFAIVLLVALTITAPVVLAAAGLATWLGRVRPTIAAIAQPVAITLLAVAIIAQFNVLSVDNLLLRDSGGPWVEAALGRNALGVMLTLASAALALLLGMWLLGRWAEPGTFTLILLILLLLQLTLLPIIHGVFYADRKVRVFDVAPQSAPMLSGAAGVVFRGSGKVTLVGLNSTGEKRMVVVNEGDLVGLSVQAVRPLPGFLDDLDRRAQAAANGADPKVQE